jgi:hypothetical protein
MMHGLANPKFSSLFIIGDILWQVTVTASLMQAWGTEVRNHSCCGKHHLYIYINNNNNNTNYT